jgi:hypothetical protein
MIFSFLMWPPGGVDVAVCSSRRRCRSATRRPLTSLLLFVYVVQKHFRALAALTIATTSQQTTGASIGLTIATASATSSYEVGSNWTEPNRTRSFRDAADYYRNETVVAMALTSARLLRNMTVVGDDVIIKPATEATAEAAAAAAAAKLFQNRKLKH